MAKTRPLAQRAAQLVKIEYKDLPAIITIEVELYINNNIVDGYGYLLWSCTIYYRMLLL